MLSTVNIIVTADWSTVWQNIANLDQSANWTYYNQTVLSCSSCVPVIFSSHVFALLQNAGYIKGKKHAYILDISLFLLLRLIKQISNPDLSAAQSIFNNYFTGDVLSHDPC